MLIGLHREHVDPLRDDPEDPVPDTVVPIRGSLAGWRAFCRAAVTGGALAGAGPERHDGQRPLGTVSTVVKRQPC